MSAAATHSRRPGASRSCRGGPAAAADAPGRGALLSLEEELFAGDPPWTAEQFQSELAGVPQTRWYVVAEANGELAGYAGRDVLGRHGGHPDPGRGAGPSASRDRHHFAVRRPRRGPRHGGARELLLGVHADNEPALALDTRHGFEQIARRRGYYQGGRTDGLFGAGPHPMTRRPQRLPSPTGWVPHRGVNTVIASQSGTIQPP